MLLMLLQAMAMVAGMGIVRAMGILMVVIPMVPILAIAMLGTHQGIITKAGIDIIHEVTISLEIQDLAILVTQPDICIR